MDEAVLDIEQWGNSLGVRLPAAVARAARRCVERRVSISVALSTGARGAPSRIRRAASAMRCLPKPAPC
jgi:antitoxin component of MazEF toxin-antitoxin module